MATYEFILFLSIEEANTDIKYDMTHKYIHKQSTSISQKCGETWERLKRERTMRREWIVFCYYDDVLFIWFREHE